MATFIDGIAASENIDSSGEKLSIAGMDISSLATTGTFNWEHKKDVPAQSVGKILKAKKIFKAEDCENEREQYFWEKCETPFVYVMGELFDEYCDSSKHLAGMFKYDHDKKDQNAYDVVGFSIEGAKIEKQGMVITRSIARKCTVTEAPCNKMAIAEMVVGEEKSEDSIFKTETNFEIQIFKNKPIAFAKDERDLEKHASILGVTPMTKSIMHKPGALTPPSAPASAPAAMPARTNNPGTHIGNTSSGHKVFSHARTHEYSNFSAKDHQEAANHHYNAATAAKDPKVGAHHFNQTKMHMQAAGTAERKEARFPKARAEAAAKPRNPAVMHKDEIAGMPIKDYKPRDARTQGRSNPKALGKADTAGMAVSGPANATQGEALASMEGKQEIHLTAKKKKKKWSMMADQAYESWEKREEFRSFMSKKMPHLAMGEIDAIGRTIALKKTMEAEEALEKLTKK